MEKPSARLILVGNAPSSGSTLLADIIDSAPFAACGPELEFFCNRNLYNFSEFKRSSNRSSYTATLRSTGVFFRKDHLAAYGLTGKQWEERLKNALDLPEFTDQFAEHFLSIRSKDSQGYLFEKTPQNVNALDLYFKTFPDQPFLYLVRNPLYVIDSLLKRGWGTYTAAATWLVHVALMWSFRKDPRMVIIRYEDLIERPFEKGSELLNKLCSGFQIDAETLKSGYESNEFRSNFAPHLSSWSTGSEREVKNANEKEISEQSKKLAAVLLRSKISSRFAKAFNVPEITMTDALQFFGYSREYEEQLTPENRIIDVPKSLSDFRKMTSKTARSWLRGDGQKIALAHFHALEMDNF